MKISEICENLGFLRKSRIFAKIQGRRVEAPKIPNVAIYRVAPLHLNSSLGEALPNVLDTRQNLVQVRRASDFVDPRVDSALR